MTGFSSLNKLFAVLFNTGLVNKIYHSVSIHEEPEAKTRYPVYKKGDEEKYVGVDDTQLMSCYLRQAGDIQNIKTEYIGSANKRYWLRVPYRVVFFNDFEERNFDNLHSTMMQMMFSELIEFNKLITDKKTLQAAEGNIKDFTFGGKTFYTAIDFNLTVKLSYNYCGIELGCGDLNNPLCAEDLGLVIDGGIITDIPIVVQGSEPPIFFYDTEASKVILWNAARKLKYGFYPLFQTYTTDSDPPSLMTIDIQPDSPYPNTTYFELFTQNTNGYIIIK